MKLGSDTETDIHPPISFGSISLGLISLGLISFGMVFSFMFGGYGIPPVLGKD